MRVGVSLQSRYTDVGPEQAVGWMLERAAAAQRADLDSLFVGDHHSTSPDCYFQNTAILGRLLAEWKQGVSGALFLLPLWHPVLVAEQVATLWAIARGRFILQCAVGAGGQQFEAMGASLRTRSLDFEAGLKIVRGLLQGESVDADRPRPIRGARIAPVPAEDVEVWIGARVEAAIDRAARLGDGWIAAPTESLKEAQHLATLYRGRCDRYGRTSLATAIRRNVYVAEDAADARMARRELLKIQGDSGSAVVGTVDEVAETFSELASMGYTDVLVRSVAIDQSRAVASLERLGAVRAQVQDL